MLRLHPTSHSDGQDGSLLLLPPPRKALRHALPVVLEGVVGPLVVFYLVLVFTGFRGALIAALTWSYLALIRRLLKGERVPLSSLWPCLSQRSSAGPSRSALRMTFAPGPHCAQP